MRYPFAAEYYDMVLFRDGYAFDEGDRLKYDLWNEKKIENWLLEEIQYINGNIPEPEKRKEDYWHFVAYRWVPSERGRRF